MREKIIMFLKTNPSIIQLLWRIGRVIMQICIFVSKRKEKTILFASFGGRNFNDSPKAIYDEICRRDEFKDWQLIWAFVNPDKFELSRGKKIKIDTFSFFKTLITSKVWVSNSGMDRGINLMTDKIIRVETWHGTPLKKICGEENQNSFGLRPEDYKGSIDNCAIRCAQSEFDQEIFARVFHASKESILLSDLPRNDELLTYSEKQIAAIKKELDIDMSKKVILYTPTYREYLVNDDMQNYIAPPMNLNKWKKKLGEKYVLLIRAHYAVSAALGIQDNDFVKNVSTYSSINDLYAISDLMISDYSSTYFDFAILDRPMLCFAYDQEEYEEKRGFYIDMSKELPCRIHKTEDDVIDDILTMDVSEAIAATKQFHRKYAPSAGSASKTIVDEIVKRLKQ